MGCVRVKCFWAEIFHVHVQLSDMIGFKLVAYEVCRLWFWKECLGYFYFLGHQPSLLAK